MLKELTLYGEVDKVRLAINRLRLHEPKEGYYVAFSGGKDSCVAVVKYGDEASKVIKIFQRNQVPWGWMK